MTGFRERGKERYGIALLLIIAAMTFIMAAPDEEWSRVVALILVGASLIASLRAANCSFRIRAAYGAVIGTSLLTALNLTIFDADIGPDFVRCSSLLLVLLATPMVALGIVRQVKEKQQITVHTMIGVLCIYLLLGIAFASAFGVIQTIENEPFFRPGDGADSMGNYLYFSLTTITTAGLGDFSAATGLGRSITALEALIGQIYLVTIVGVIVGNLGRKR